MSVVGRVQINRPGDTGPVTPPSPVDDPPVSYLDLIVADGAVAVWPLDENDSGDTYADVVGSNPAVLSSGMTSDYASTPIGPSASASPHFEGLGTVSSGPEALAAVTATSATFAVGVGDFALECWVKYDTIPPGAEAEVPMVVGTLDYSNYFASTFTTAGQFRFNDADNEAIVTGMDYDDQLLHHCVFTRRSGSYFIIVDGTEVASLTPATTNSLSASSVVQLAGADYDAFFPANFAYTMAGQLAWCAFYDVGLTESQAIDHYTVGSA